MLCFHFGPISGAVAFNKRMTVSDTLSAPSIRSIWSMLILVTSGMLIVLNLKDDTQPPRVDMMLAKRRVSISRELAAVGPARVS